MGKLIKINALDNVAVALEDLPAGTSIDVGENKLILSSDVKRGHKFALRYIGKGENVVKYGYPIGKAITEISPGEHVHTHNLKSGLIGLEKYEYNPKSFPLAYEKENLTFKGYRRKHGVGIRNEIWIVPTVGCVNQTGGLIAETFRKNGLPENIDAVEVWKHPYGCSQLGDDHENTRRILAGIVKHPNAGGVLVLGLGCENNIVSEFRKSLGEFDTERVKFLVAQDEEDEIESGVRTLQELAEIASKDKRVSIPLSELRVGLKCGGSDGLSGITANPIAGLFSDFLIAQGGTSVLAEVPEMFGAETILMDRAENREVFEKTVSLINNFKNFFMSHNQPVFENPSPGNKEGGITTLEEKSLGCIQKGGFAPVAEVLKYGDIILKRGLNLLSTPGNDPVSTTALGASGCQMILFTTGRGTPLGTFVPTLKISTNSALSRKKPHWIDFDSGPAATGEKKLNELLKDLIPLVIKTANGEKTRNEEYGFKEIAIFKTGITL